MRKMESGRGEVRASLSRKQLGQEEASTWAFLSFLPLARKSHPSFLPYRIRGPSPLASPNQLLNLLFRAGMEQ